jgi:hypothetical protein
MYQDVGARLTKTISIIIVTMSLIPLARFCLECAARRLVILLPLAAISPDARCVLRLLINLAVRK